MPYKNTNYPKVMANMNRKITDKVKIAIDYLEKQGFQEIAPTEKLRYDLVHEQFYVVCDDSFNGIALVTFQLKQARRFTVQYINNSMRVITIKNDNNYTQIGVDTTTGLLILSDTKQRINIISPMWNKPYKPKMPFNPFSKPEPPPRLKVITNSVPGIAPRPVVPAPISNRVGGRTRRRKRTRPSRRSNKGAPN